MNYHCGMQIQAVYMGLIPRGKKFKIVCNENFLEITKNEEWRGLWCLTPLPTIFQLKDLKQWKNIVLFILLVFLQVSFLFVCLMVFKATFNSISVISWRSVLLVEETAGPGENHRPVTSH